MWILDPGPILQKNRIRINPSREDSRIRICSTRKKARIHPIRLQIIFCFFLDVNVKNCIKKNWDSLIFFTKRKSTKNVLKNPSILVYFSFMDFLRRVLLYVFARQLAIIRHCPTPFFSPGERRGRKCIFSRKINALIRY